MIMKNVFLSVFFLLAVSCISVSCDKYTAKDYIDDLNELIEETTENASSYTAEDWEKVSRKFEKINKKGAKACKKLTDKQIKEVDKLRDEMEKTFISIDGDKLKEKLNDASEQASEALKDIFGK